MKYEYPHGSTPLDPDEIRGLIPSHIETQKELNEFEFLSISTARDWAFGNKRSNLLSTDFIKSLHKKMFGLVWKWAGSFRLTNKNLGVDYHQIPVEVKSLCDDASFWFKNEIYPTDESAIRFHHRLVSIHPFSNGNGRHSRMMADLILFNHTGNVFSWGKNFMMTETDECRRRYIDALRKADNNDYDPLILFAKS